MKQYEFTFMEGMPIMLYYPSLSVYKLTENDKGKLVLEELRQHQLPPIARRIVMEKFRSYIMR